MNAILSQRSKWALSVAALVASAGSIPAQESDLITRDRISLRLVGAQKVIEAATRKAEEMGLRVNIAVVDDGGHLLAFARMDGARPASAYTAQTKATACALLRAETGPLPSEDEVNAHLSLAVENAATAGGGKFTTLKGGVPIVIDGQVVGAIGVGGASGEQDREIGRAGVAALRSSGSDD